MNYFPWMIQRREQQSSNDIRMEEIRHDAQDEQDAERSSRPPDQHYE